MNWQKNKPAFFPVLLALVCMGSGVAGQRMALEAAVYQGSVWRHTPKLRTQTGEVIGAQELGVRVQMIGLRDWHAWQRYPSLGVSAAHFELGTGNHGHAFAAIPWLNVPVFTSGRMRVNFRVGSGAAWVSNPYNWWDNPQQNAIGSHFNNITQFRLGSEARLNAHANLLLGGSFTHFSNGGIALPNFGVNILSAWVGATWSPKPLKNEMYKPAGGSRKNIAQRWGGLFQTGYAAVQIATFDGPKYPVKAAGVSLFYHFNRLHRASAGIDYEMNVGVREWGLHSALFADEAAARRGATRLAWFVGEEFLFGDIGIQLQAGRYFRGKFNAFTAKQLYSKLTMRYYLPAVFAPGFRLFAGITLKAHAFTAEYMALNAGFAFAP